MAPLLIIPLDVCDPDSPVIVWNMGHLMVTGEKVESHDPDIPIDIYRHFSVGLTGCQVF
jgi:hypothetical protein